MRTIFFAIVLLTPALSSASLMTQKLRVGNQEVLSVFDTAKTNDYNIIEGAATNGSPSVTIPLDMAWEKLRIWVFVTYAANTYVTVALQCSRDSTNHGKVQSRKIVDGTATLSDLSDQKTLGAADQDIMVEYDVRGCMTAKITLGGDNTDVADLQAVAVR